MRTFITIALLASASFAYGHGDEDHSAPAPVVTQSMAPRSAAATADFELVSSLDGDKLVIYLDKFDTNELVANAKIEVEGAGLNGVAKESAPGVYVLDVASPVAPGKHALTISVETADAADLISTSIEIAQPKAAVEVAKAWNPQYTWGAVGLLALGALIVVVGRLRKK